MKLKILLAIILVLGINTFGSSEECPSRSGNETICNKEADMNVSAKKQLISASSEFEFSAILLLLQI
jgi:hypothetical protein